MLTLLTGSPYFPGGIGEFNATKNEFLVFEDGPSEDMVLQWASYRDASDQCSLSRIWGGIHPPADDLPGRLIGEQIGIDAFEFAVSHFNSVVTGSSKPQTIPTIFPNPSSNQITLLIPSEINRYTVEIFDLNGNKLIENQYQLSDCLSINIEQLVAGTYLLKVRSEHWVSTQKLIKK